MADYQDEIMFYVDSITALSIKKLMEMEFIDKKGKDLGAWGFILHGMDLFRNASEEDREVVPAEYFAIMDSIRRDAQSTGKDKKSLEKNLVRMKTAFSEAKLRNMRKAAGEDYRNVSASPEDAKQIFDNLSEDLDTMLNALKDADSLIRGSSDEYKEIQARLGELKKLVSERNRTKEEQEKSGYTKMRSQYIEKDPFLDDGFDMRLARRVQVELTDIAQKAHVYVQNRKDVELKASSNYKMKRVQAMKDVFVLAGARVDAFKESTAKVIRVGVDDLHQEKYLEGLSNAFNQRPFSSATLSEYLFLKEQLDEFEEKGEQRLSYDDDHAGRYEAIYSSGASVALAKGLYGKKVKLTTAVKCYEKAEKYLKGVKEEAENALFYENADALKDMIDYIKKENNTNKERDMQDLVTGREAKNYAGKITGDRDVDDILRAMALRELKACASKLENTLEVSAPQEPAKKASKGGMVLQ